MSTDQIMFTKSRILLLAWFYKYILVRALTRASFSKAVKNLLSSSVTLLLLKFAPVYFSPPFLFAPVLEPYMGMSGGRYVFDLLAHLCSLLYLYPVVTTFFRVTSSTQTPFVTAISSTVLFAPGRYLQMTREKICSVNLSLLRFLFGYIQW